MSKAYRQTQEALPASEITVPSPVTEDSDPKLDHWKSPVAVKTRQAWGRAPVLDAPVPVTLTFRIARSKFPYDNVRNAAVLRPTAPAAPHVKPNLDKLLRAILDALTTTQVWAEDARATTIIATKVYARPGQQTDVDISLIPVAFNDEESLAA